MIIHIADIISEASGHYAVLIVEDGKVILFDSMQRKNEKGFSGGGSSFYTAFFAQVAMDVLGVGLDDITCPEIPSCDEKCLQITGGFIEYDDLAQTLGREPTEAEKYVYMQNADSQNHFCYFWAIWYTHMYIKHGKDFLEEFIEKIETSFILMDSLFDLVILSDFLIIISF